jgi:hypothetical protein
MFRVDKPAAHRVLGIAAMVGGWIQAITGIFRADAPAKGARPTPLRAIWLWSHRWLAIAIVATPHLPGHKRDSQFNTRSGTSRLGSGCSVLFIAAWNCGRHCEAQNTELQSWYSRSVIVLLNQPPGCNYVNSDRALNTDL